MDNASSILLSRLTHEALPLLVCLTGGILALVWLGRKPLRAALCLSGRAVLFLTTLSSALLHASFEGRMIAGDLDRSQFIQRLQAIWYLSIGGRSLGVGLLIAASLVGGNQTRVRN